MVFNRQNNCFRLPTNIRERVNYFKPSFNLDYSDLKSHPFLEQLAKYHNTSKGDLLLDNGADGCLFTIFNYVRQKGGNLWLPKASYEGFSSIAHSLNISYKSYNSYDELGVTNEKDFVVICHPFNPTGESQEGEVLNLLQTFNGQLIIDESYVDYNESQSLKSLVLKRDKDFIIRSFSKAFGLPDIRVGYIIAKDATLKLSRFKVPYSNSSFSLQAAFLFLENLSLWKMEKENFLRELNVLQEELQHKGVISKKSSTNFIFIKENLILSKRKFIDKINEDGIEYREFEVDGKLGVRVSFESIENINKFKSSLFLIKSEVGHSELH